jgi:Kef-type K+ transport system membrane component KefB
MASLIITACVGSAEDYLRMFAQLALLVAAGLLGPVLAAGRRPLAPVLVGELVAGAIIGRTGFGIVDPAAQPFPAFYALGFAMLMLAAGTEVDLRSPGLRHGIARGALALAVAVAAAIPIGLLLANVLHLGHVELFVVLLAGSSAAVAFPALQERKLTGPAIPLLIAWITLADGLTALLLPLTLTGPAKVPGALAGDLLVVMVCAATMAVGGRLAGRPAVAEAERESRQRGWALQLRLSVLLLLVLGAIADRSGGSLLVAGFGAGIVLRRFDEPDRLALQLSGLASGFFVPAFFVLLGATLNLRDLVGDPRAIALAAAMAVAAVVVHLVAAAVAAGRQRLPTGLLASAQLGLPAAAAALGLSSHALSPAVAAALVAGGCLTLVPATVGAILMAGANPAGAPAVPHEGGGNHP